MYEKWCNPVCLGPSCMGPFIIKLQRELFLGVLQTEPPLVTVQLLVLAHHIKIIVLNCADTHNLNNEDKITNYFVLFLFNFQMNLLLKEYLTSGDVSEAGRCLRELEVPHFHHELVYEVFKTSLHINYMLVLSVCEKRIHTS